MKAERKKKPRDLLKIWGGKNTSDCQSRAPFSSDINWEQMKIQTPRSNSIWQAKEECSLKKQQHSSITLLWQLLIPNANLWFLLILLFPFAFMSPNQQFLVALVAVHSHTAVQWSTERGDLPLLRNGGLQQSRCRRHKNRCALAPTAHRRQKPRNFSLHKYPPGFCCGHSQPITKCFIRLCVRGQLQDWKMIFTWCLQ